MSLLLLLLLLKEEIKVKDFEDTLQKMNNVKKTCERCGKKKTNKCQM